MTLIHPVASHINDPEANAGTTGFSDRRWQSESPDFFAAMLALLRRAELGRGFGVAPPVTRNRTEGRGAPKQAGHGDNVATRQAKNIYQAMLDITGH